MSLGGSQRYWYRKELWFILLLELNDEKVALCSNMEKWRMQYMENRCAFESLTGEFVFVSDCEAVEDWHHYSPCKHWWLEFVFGELAHTHTRENHTLINKLKDHDQTPIANNQHIKYIDGNLSVLFLFGCDSSCMHAESKALGKHTKGSLVSLVLFLVEKYAEPQKPHIT